MCIFPAKPLCVSVGSVCPVTFCSAHCLLARGPFYLWQVRLLSCKTNPLPATPDPHPPNVGMSRAMSCHSLRVWIGRSVCHAGMRRAVCILGPWKLVTPYCGSRDYPWKEPGCPPFSSLLSNSLTLILLSSGLLPSAWTHAVKLAHSTGGGSPAI